MHTDPPTGVGYVSLGTAGTDAAHYRPKPFGDSPDIARSAFVLGPGIFTVTNNVSTAPKSATSLSGVVTFQILTDGDVTIKVPEDTPAGTYALVFRDIPNEVVLNSYECLLCDEFPWWQKGTFPGVTVTV
jgi:hypothetical protein